MATNIAFQPLADRILVAPLPAKDKTTHGIIIPETAQKKTNQGVVVATGPGTVKEPMELKVGDRVVYGQYSGQKIELEEAKEEHWIMRQSDVLGRLL